MAYVLNKTDGTILTELSDNNIDQVSTDLTLIGKNISNYGEYINENFIRLLENFSNSSPPNFPIRGQLWYDISDNRLKVYDGQGFRTSSGPIVSGVVPDNLIQGDIWIDNLKNQMYFYDGTDLLLAGPIYSSEQGISGHEVLSVLDVPGNLKIIVKLWVNQTLLGIYSKEEFTPKTPIPGFTGTIKKGFNASTLTDMKFHVTATKAEALVDSNGNLKNINAFVSTEIASNMIGTLSIQNSVPLVLGPNQNNEIRINSTSFQLISNNSGQDFRIKVKNNSLLLDAVVINPVDSYVGIFKSNPTASLDVEGTVKLSGDLILPKITVVSNTIRSIDSNDNITLVPSGSGIVEIASGSSIDGNLAVTGSVTASSLALSGNITANNYKNWSVKTSNYTASAGDRIIADTTSSQFDITLPSSPSIGDTISIIDGGVGFSTNSITIVRDDISRKINGSAADLTVSTDFAAFTLVYTGTTRGWAYDNVPV